MRQVHPAEPRRPARGAHRGRRQDPPGGGRVHVPGRRPLPVAHRPRQHRARPPLRRCGRGERRERAGELLRLVHLDDAADLRPHQLSGGMRQRVALARALAQDRPLLLMDEPFAALDAITRDLLHGELERVWRQTGRTVVFVTHNVAEAVRLGQRVLLLSSRPGRVVAEWDVPAAARHDAPAAAALTAAITARLGQEIRRHAH
ncbi:ATP-binding cassette domain-containing protein [Micrococcus luteus]